MSRSGRQSRGRACAGPAKNKTVNLSQYFLEANLNCGVVGVLVRHKECSFDVTAIWVFPCSIEDLVVEINVVDIDGIVKGYGDHLWDFKAVRASRTKIPGNLGA